MFVIGNGSCTRCANASTISARQVDAGVPGERLLRLVMTLLDLALALFRRSVLAVSLLLATVVACSAQLTFTEYAGPTTPTFEDGHALGDITSGPDGNLWFTEGYAFGAQTNIGRITPAGVTTYFPVPSGGSEGGIAAGPDGNLWFAEYRTNRIGRIATDGTITEFTIPGGGMYPYGITAGPDGNMWFTGAGGAGLGKIGRITPDGGITTFPTPGNTDAIRIVTGSDGNLWFTENVANQIGRITPAGAITEYPVPTSGSHPYYIAAGPDGNLWFTEEIANKIARITTSGVITEFSIASGGNPLGITKGPDGNLWFAEYLGNFIGRITTAGVITEFPVPTVGANPDFIAEGFDGNLWFIEPDANKIVKASSAGRGWLLRASMPTLRDSARGARGPDGRLYVFGGVNANSPLGLNTVEAYDVHSNTWTFVPPMPTGRAQLAVVNTPDGKIYALGGFPDERSWAGSAAVEAFDPSTGTWVARASMPTPRGGLAAALGADGRIYVIGGANSNADGSPILYETVDVYDPAADTWSAAPSMSTSRYALTAIAAPDGRIYAIGGSDGTAYLSSVEAFDVANQTWQSVSALPSVLVDPGSVVGPDGLIYVLGGATPAAPAVNAVETYSVATGTWTPGPTLTAPRQAMAPVLGPDGGVYIFGGADGQNYLGIAEVYYPEGDLNPPTTTVAISGNSVGAGVYSGPVSVTLSAIDNRSGVFQILYSVDGAGEQTYSGPITVTGSGAHSVSFHSVDLAGNTEATRTVTFTEAVSTNLTVNTVSGLAGQKRSLTAQLRRSATNAGIAGETVTFKVDGTVVGSDVTNATGHASFSYTLPESLGDHVLTAVFAGDGTYIASSANGTLTVNFANTTLAVTDRSAQAGDTINLIADLNRVAGGGVAGRTLTFTVDGQPVGTAMTNAGGHAVLAYTVPLAIGSKTIGVSFTGDSFYGASSGSGTLTVSQAVTKLAVTDRTVKVGRTVTLRARLHRVSDGAYLTGQTVQFSVNGSVVGTGATDSGGYANLLYTPSTVGTFPILAQFAGDTINAGTADYGTLTVTP